MKKFWNFLLSYFSISRIPSSTFDDLHSLEWLKLYNNELTTLHYELMEPVLDTLKHIDIHSKFRQIDIERHTDSERQTDIQTDRKTIRRTGGLSEIMPMFRPVYSNYVK